MSLSLIAWNPRIDEPSKPSPSVNTSSVSSFSGSEKCCQVPGRSQKRTSTTCTPASCALRITSAGEAVGAFAPLAVVVGSNVAVIRASPPGSRVARASRAETTRARRRARGRRALENRWPELLQACGKVSGSCSSVKQNLRQLQKNASETRSGGQRVHK